MLKGWTRELDGISRIYWRYRYQREGGEKFGSVSVLVDRDLPDSLEELMLEESVRIYYEAHSLAPTFNAFWTHPPLDAFERALTCIEIAKQMPPAVPDDLLAYAYSIVEEARSCLG